jgi:hypothetical protein
LREPGGGEDEAFDVPAQDAFGPAVRVVGEGVAEGPGGLRSDADVVGVVLRVGGGFFDDGFFWFWGICVAA